MEARCQLLDVVRVSGAPEAHRISTGARQAGVLWLAWRAPYVCALLEIGTLCVCPCDVGFKSTVLIDTWPSVASQSWGSHERGGVGSVGPMPDVLVLLASVSGAFVGLLGLAWSSLLRALLAVLRRLDEALDSDRFEQQVSREPPPPIDGYLVASRPSREGSFKAEGASLGGSPGASFKAAG